MSETLEIMIARHEGVKLKPYEDITGHITIGVGRNLSSIGISYREAMRMLDEDILRVKQELTECFKWFLPLSKPRRDALVDMCFNLGLTRFLGFKKMIIAIEERDWSMVADEMLNSLWAEQVGDRAIELAKMVREG